MVVCFQKFRSYIQTVGLIFLLSSCATAPKLTNKKLPKNDLQRVTIAAFQKPVDVTNTRKKLKRFKTALSRGALNQSDWAVHDELLEDYIFIRNRSFGKIIVPAKSRLAVQFETYCLNSNKASPSSKEIYHWQKGNPDIPYYRELLRMRRSNEIQQHDLQGLLWNLQNETRWDDYPNKQKAILQKIDSQVAFKLPSNLKDEIKNKVSDALFSQPLLNQAYNNYQLLKGKYYEYNDFKKSVESLTSKYDLSDYDDLTEIPDTELYSQSDSRSFSEQSITFYNPTDRLQELNIDEYYLASEREDVQRIGINPYTSDDPALLSDLEKTLYETMARLGIGFTPVLGDVADLYEVIYGKDFLTGKFLSFDERLASAMGVVLSSGSAYRQVKRWINAPTDYLSKFESELEKVAKKSPNQPNYNDVKRVLNDGQVGAHGFRRGLDYKGTQELSEFLRDARISRLERTQTIKSFEPATVHRRVVSNDETVYRWHSDDKEVKQMGRFVTPERIDNTDTGRNTLALPKYNQMKHLDSFTLKQGAIVFEGKIAPNFGHNGGGKQILITGDLEKLLRFEKRIK